MRLEVCDFLLKGTQTSSFDLEGKGGGGANGRGGG